MIDFTHFDALGQFIKSIEACGTEDARTQLFRWHPSGELEFLILENPDTGQQVTQWLFGSTLESSEVAQNGVIVGKVYPTGESSSVTVNRQGETNNHTEPNGTNHEYIRNKVGAVIHDAVTALGPDIDDTVLRISSVFNNRGLIELISSFDNATIGAGNIINQVKLLHDAFNQPIEDQQEHTGAVDASTPAVTYGFTDGSNNTLRPTSVSTPSGQQTDVDYGAAGSIDQAFNRPAALRVAGESDNLVDYEYAGLAMVTNVTYPGPDVELALATAGTIGDAGDSLTGFDAFNRIIDIPWRKKSTSAVLAQIGYGYDVASRRKWRQDLTPQANNLRDQFFGYDKLSQVKSAARGTLNTNRTEIGAIPNEEEGWEYDETGNWLEYQRAEDGTQTIDETRTHNPSNQIKAVDGTNAGIAYDTNGNMTRVPTGSGLQGPARTLKWDAWDRMVEVRKKSDNSLIANFAYDGLTRRTALTDSANVVKHFYYNTDWRAVEERIAASTNPSKIYFWGAQNRWELVRRDRDTNGNGTLDETLYCLRDAMDPVAIVDTSGAVQERFQYTAFGEVTYLAADYSARNASDFNWEFLFHGEFRDEETGYYNYGYRYYVAELGRWLSRDPIKEEGGGNLYGFVWNRPIISIDVFGLKNGGGVRPGARPRTGFSNVHHYNPPRSVPPRLNTGPPIIDAHFFELPHSPARPPRQVDPKIPPVYTYQNDPPVFVGPHTRVITLPYQRPTPPPPPPPTPTPPTNARRRPPPKLPKVDESNRPYGQIRGLIGPALHPSKYSVPDDPKGSKCRLIEWRYPDPNSSEIYTSKCCFYCKYMCSGIMACVVDRYRIDGCPSEVNNFWVAGYSKKEDCERRMLK